MRVFYSSLLCVLAVMASPARADDGPHRWINVHNHGAKCNGQHDDTQAFRKAIADAPAGGVVWVPPGRCVLTDTVEILETHAVSIVGSGRASQIFQRADKTLFQFRGTSQAGLNGIMIKDLYLGSAATAPGTSLLKLINAHHNRIDNVTMLGGNYGLHLRGSLLNTIVDLRSGTNFGGFFVPSCASSAAPCTSVTNTWVRGERTASPDIAANANTFIAPVLEGGVNGIWITDTQAQGSVTIVGGTIEGVSGTGLYLEKTFLPSSITGTHFEANGVADVTLEGTFNVRLSAIVALTKVNLRSVGAYTTKNVQISDSIVEKLHIDPPTPFAGGRIQLQNITRGLAACNPGDYDIQDGSVIQVNVACYPN